MNICDVFGAKSAAARAASSSSAFDGSARQVAVNERARLGVDGGLAAEKAEISTTRAGEYAPELGETPGPSVIALRIRVGDSPAMPRYDSCTISSRAKVESRLVARIRDGDCLGKHEAAVLLPHPEHDVKSHVPLKRCVVTERDACRALDPGGWRIADPDAVAAARALVKAVLADVVVEGARDVVTGRTGLILSSMASKPPIVTSASRLSSSGGGPRCTVRESPTW